MHSKPTFKKTLIGFLAAAAVSLILNQIWNFIATGPLDLKPIEGPWPLMVAISSILPLVLAAIVYFLLVKYTTKGNTIFTILAVVLTFLSLWSSFQTVLPDGNPAPDGFALLTAPMHFISGFAAAFLIPRFSK